MNVKRKRIFKDALFNVPFVIIISAVTVGFMFCAGRTPYDIKQIAASKIDSKSDLDVSAYYNQRAKSYKVDYYYGDKESEKLYAEFVYDGKGDTPVKTLTLYEARNGFDAGEYSRLWVLGDEYVTYTPPDSTVESGAFEKYLASEVPLMANLVSSYSWDTMLQNSGAVTGCNSSSEVGVNLFLWDSTENDVLRDNFLWGIGGNPKEMYSYIKGSQGEYKKAVLK